jgi:hypothetical protein
MCSQSQSHIATDGQSISRSLCRVPSGLMTRYLLLFDSYGTVFVWRPLWREDGSVFLYAAGPRQRSLSRVRVPWGSWPYFTVSDFRLPFSPPPTTRRIAVEVFDPASTPGVYVQSPCPFLITSRHEPHRKHNSSIVAFMSVAARTCLPCRCPETAWLYMRPSRGRCIATALHATIYMWRAK